MTSQSQISVARTAAGWAVAIVLSVTSAGVASADTLISAGWDLLKTQPGTQFWFPTIPNPQVIDLEGLPIGTIDLGSGPIDVGATDTIIERVSDADIDTFPDVIDIEIVALSLQSVAPVDLGFGAGFEDIFITLNTSSPSIQSQMTITDAGEGEPHGTFDSVLNFSFDLVGSVGGFYATIEDTFTATNQDWQHAPTNNLQIDGVNHLLNGLDETGDFWADGLVTHSAGANTLVTRTAPVPEPATAVLVALGLGGMAALRRRGS